MFRRKPEFGFARRDMKYPVNGINAIEYVVKK
nr:MAG TPA: hypothetical protein [Caudoviricetes sp.]